MASLHTSAFFTRYNGYMVRLSWPEDPSASFNHRIATAKRYLLGNTQNSGFIRPDLSSHKSRFYKYPIQSGIPDAGISCQINRQTDKQLHGTLTQDGYTFPLILSRQPVVFHRPQTPQPPFPYRSEEVTFRNEAAGIILAGTLTLPLTPTQKSCTFYLRQRSSGSGQYLSRTQNFSGYSRLPCPKRYCQLASRRSGHRSLHR